MNDADIMPTAFLAALFFRGHPASARTMRKPHGSIPHMVRKSRLSRRLQRITEIFVACFHLFAHIGKELHTEAVSGRDSLPLAVWDKRRMRRSQLSSTADFRGYQARKQRYLYGRKIPLMVTTTGQPVECFLPPGGCGDVDALQS